MQSAELRRRLSLTSIPTLLVQRRLCWFDHAARRPGDELIKDLYLPTPPRTWRRRIGGQLKTWATTIKADLEPLFAYERSRKDWMKVSSELATGPPSLECLRPRRGQLNWFNPLRVNAAASTSK